MRNKQKLLITLLFAHCSLLFGCYTLKQGTTMLGYLSRAVPLDSLLESEADASEAEKNRLFVEQDSGYTPLRERRTRP